MSSIAHNGNTLMSVLQAVGPRTRFLLVLTAVTLTLLVLSYQHAITNGSIGVTRLISGVAPVRLETKQQIKMMIVGDSMTDGAEGDWTWRYRLWQWTRDNGLDIDFVGPYSGTAPSPAAGLASQPSDQSNSTLVGQYAEDVDSAFDSDHYAAWGKTVVLDMSLIEGLVSQYQPDYLLMMLGFNDLLWWGGDDDHLINNTETFVQNARSSKPDLKFAIANVPQQYYAAREAVIEYTTRYNARLPDKLAVMSTLSSPCAHVEVQKVYSCAPDLCPSGYDGIHPNARGEYEIASAFSTSLHTFYGLGSSSLAVPAAIPRRPVPIPKDVQLVSTIDSINATWASVFGAYSYDVEISVDGSDFHSSSAETNRFDTTWPQNAHSCTIRVRTNCGMQDYLKSPWTEGISVTAKPESDATFLR